MDKDIIKDIENDNEGKDALKEKKVIDSEGINKRRDKKNNAN